MEGQIVIPYEDDEAFHPIGLGRNPTIVFTPHQIQQSGLKLYTKVTVGCISGIIIGVGLCVAAASSQILFLLFELSVHNHVNVCGLL